jgi:hypothetical protein
VRQNNISNQYIREGGGLHKLLPPKMGTLLERRVVVLYPFLLKMTNDNMWRGIRCGESR